jgi:sRNA-binding regulator protein Hfq
MDVRLGDHVLDIGCRGGMAIKRVAGIAVDGFVAGIDHSEIMVQQTGHRMLVKYCHALERFTMSTEHSAYLAMR